MLSHESVRKNQFVTLPDGRRLGFTEYGVPNGRPVLFFHGAPGSSHIHTDMAEIATRRGVRLIAVDRPGYGLSDPKPGRTLLSWADDFATLTSSLGIAGFSIIGFSAGSPYPLACAYKLPAQVFKIALVATLAPVDAPGVMEGMSPMASGLYALAQTNPDELRAAFAAVAPTASALIKTMSASASEWDKQILYERATGFKLEYSHTLLNGSDGMATDFILNAGGWGFPLVEIKSEVHLWSGTLDQNTPPVMTHYLAAQLPNSHIHTLHDEGHFVLYRHWEEILQSVA